MRSLEPPEGALSTVVRAYSAANPNSARRYAEAGKVMPGGNTRSVLFYAPFPLCIVVRSAPARCSRPCRYFQQQHRDHAAGLTAMTEVLTPNRSRDLNRRGDRLRNGLNTLFARHGACLSVTGLGSVMNIHASGDAATKAKVKELVFFDLITRGIYLARRGLIALSLPITDGETAVFIDAMTDVLSARSGILCAPAQG
jgi:hypothetical protein